MPGSEAHKYLYDILRVAAMKRVTQRWFDPRPPPIKRWKTAVDEILQRKD